MGKKVPKARKKGGTRTITKYRTRTVTKRAKRRGGGSFGGGWIPPKNDLMDMGGSYAYGHFEAAAAKDAKHFLHSLPKPIDGVGFTGNVGIVAWVAYKMTRQPLLGHLAKGTLCVASYKLARRGKAYDKATDGLDLSGYDDGTVDMEGLDAEVGDEDDEVGDTYEED